MVWMTTCVECRESLVASRHHIRTRRRGFANRDVWTDLAALSAFPHSAAYNNQLTTKPSSAQTAPSERDDRRRNMSPAFVRLADLRERQTLCVWMSAQLHPQSCALACKHMPRQKHGQTAIVSGHKERNGVDNASTTAISPSITNRAQKDMTVSGPFCGHATPCHATRRSLHSALTQAFIVLRTGLGARGTPASPKATARAGISARALEGGEGVGGGRRRCARRMNWQKAMASKSA